MSPAPQERSLLMLELNQTIYTALASALGLDPDHWETSFRIRQAFVNPSPPPPPPDQDVLYFHLTPEEQPPLTETSTEDGEDRIFRYAPYLLQLVFYGPKAEALAWQVWHLLFLDGGCNPRRILRESGIFPVPRPQSPVLVWEEWQKQHRPRADLTIRLRVAFYGPLRKAETIKSPPEIRLSESSG